MSPGECYYFICGDEIPMTMSTLEMALDNVFQIANDQDVCIGGEPVQVWTLKQQHRWGVFVGDTNHLIDAGWERLL